MAIPLVVMIAVLLRDDRRSRRLARLGPSGPSMTTAGSTICPTS